MGQNANRKFAKAPPMRGAIALITKALAGPEGSKTGVSGSTDEIQPVMSIIARFDSTEAGQVGDNNLVARHEICIAAGVDGCRREAGIEIGRCIRIQLPAREKDLVGAAAEINQPAETRTLQNC